MGVCTCMWRHACVHGVCVGVSHVCVHMCMGMHVHGCVQGYMGVCTCVRANVCTCVYRGMRGMHRGPHGCVHVCVYARVCPGCA